MNTGLSRVSVEAVTPNRRVALARDLYLQGVLITASMKALLEPKNRTLKQCLDVNIEDARHPICKGLTWHGQGLGHYEYQGPLTAAPPFAITFSLPSSSKED